MKNTTKVRRPKRSSPSSGSAISCAATNPDQWLTLYEDGRVRVHTRNLDAVGKLPYRTLDYRPKLKSDREAIRRLIWHLNLVAAGDEGTECQVCDCFSPNDTGERCAVAHTLDPIVGTGGQDGKL